MDAELAAKDKEIEALKAQIAAMRMRMEEETK